MRYWYHKSSGSVAALTLVWAQAVDEPDDYWPPSRKKRDRASGIEHGSGDYFIAYRKPTKFASSDGRQPPQLTGDVDGYSRDRTQHIVWWVVDGWEFSGGMNDLNRPQAQWHCACTRYQMMPGTGKCRKMTYNNFNIYVSQGKDDINRFKDLCQSFFFRQNPTKTSVVNLLASRSDVYKGEMVFWDEGFNFRNGEWHTYRNISELGTYLNGSATRFESAYVKAWESLPSAECNGIANILEAISGIRTAIGALSNPIGAVSEFATNLADPRNAWLAYRYQYTTTKLDVEEYTSLIRRLRKLRSMCKHQSITVSGEFSDETGTYECICSVDVNTVLPEGLNDLLDMCGLKLTASNLWDMVPYSFVVDWFIKLGDVLRGFESWAGSLDFSPKDIWYTYKSSYDDQFVYYRVRGRALGMLPAYSEHQASGRTIKMRVADAISLFTP